MRMKLMDSVGKKLIVFHLVLLSMASSLFFALVLIIKLMRPLLLLRSSVDSIAAEDPESTVETASQDEIAQMAHTLCGEDERVAALMLGINRNTLRKKLRDHGLN